MKSLEILIFSICLEVKKNSRVWGNKECVSKLLLDDTAITKLLISIAYFTCLASLSLRGCEHLMPLCRTFYKYEFT